MDISEHQKAKKAVTAGAIGSFVEFYDFAIYGYFATVISVNFFPSDSQIVSLLATFAAFAAAFLIRPLGAIIFGHYGDKVGRKSSLSMAVILMGISTLVIGLVPTHEQIGVLAPVLLVIARLLQGLSAGGEWGGSATFIVEYAPSDRRGMYGSWVQVSAFGGMLAGSAIGALTGIVMSEEMLNNWGWRIPFLFGGVLGVVGLYLRSKIEDTPAFKEQKLKNDIKNSPVKSSLTEHWKESLTAVGFTVAWTVATYMLLTYMPTFIVTTTNLSLTQALFTNSIGLAVLVLFVPIMGTLSDRIGRKPLLISFAILTVLLTYPLFLLISTGNILFVLFGQILFGIILAVFSGPGPTALVEMFPTKVRYTALGISYNVTVAIFGGTAPFISTFLISQTGNHSMPGFYLIITAIITLITVSRMAETKNSPLREK
ncbi:MFS transporter [Lentibacillus sp. N15]|uniref:MFS transporter n=1 Tax=Lentibacillus songyuanensis TaxID=3136161 RepID=UPI0031B9D155